MDIHTPELKLNLKKITIAIIVLVVIAVLTSFGRITDFLADYIWFKEVGYTSTYVKQVFAKLYIGVPFFFAFTAFIYFYFYRIKMNYYKHMNILTTKEDEKAVNRIMGIIAAILGLFFSFAMSQSFWMQILRFMNSTSFGKADPIFNNDISFYVFVLPLLTEVFSFMLGFIVFLMIMTFIVYVVLISIRQPAEKEELGSKIRRLRTETGIQNLQKRVMNLALGQIILIGIVFFLIIALRSYLATFGLLYSPQGAVFGAGYTDIRVTLWVYRIQIAVGVLSAIALIVAKNKGNMKLAAIGPIALIAVYVLGMGAEAIVQGVVVAPNELTRERPYIENNLRYTKSAYGFDDIKVNEFDVQQDLTYEELLANDETISNISLNDYRPTNEAFNQLQGLRGYYNFHDVDIDRYIIDGNLTQVFLSVRELDKDALDENAQTWVNRHLKYTHGYGLTMAPVNRVTPSGQPQMIVRNVPPISDYEELEIEVPQIYFGELTNDYVVVNTDETEFDYPSGEVLQTTSYEGDAGIELSFFNKLLYSSKQKSFNLMVSGSINSESRILLHRNIRERARKIAPFLSYDEDPYAVVLDGKIYYIIDGYTSTQYYPYSQPFEGTTGLNYIRNSFKVIVDAYNGDIDYYIVDTEDPLIQTYEKIFPDLFKSMDEMPEGFVSHLRYPQSVFDIQARMYGTYHTNQPDVFYNREDKWEIARQTYQDEMREMESLYFTFKLPEEEKAEFVLSIPYTPNQKQNMIAFLVGRNDGENYGELEIFQFPEDKTIIGPQQVEARISNNDVISRDLSLWNSRGSQVIRGNILTIPINNSILYVEPLYIRADSERAIPEVRRIIASFNDRVVMRDNLEDALAALFGVQAAPAPGQTPDAPADPDSELPTDEIPDTTDIDGLDTQALIRRAGELYESAQQALRSGSLSDYERNINELGEILDRLEQEAGN